MKLLDRICGALLLLGALLHGYGSLAGYEAGSEVLVWSLSGALCAGLIAILNLLRAGRPGDAALAWITGGASLGWAAVALAFGFAIGDVADPRVLWHAIAALALSGFSLRAATAQARGRAALVRWRNKERAGA